jgi:DUF1009 family protein
MAREGVLTRREPDKDEMRDLEYGIHVAREVARLDLGQTIAVKERAVVAVEAMEGTDAVIARAGQLTRGKSFVVVKVARPAQDMRFDVPVIGSATIQAMKDAGATAISITADKTLLFDKEELIDLADKARISIVAQP